MGMTQLMTVFCKSVHVFSISSIVTALIASSRTFSCQNSFTKNSCATKKSPSFDVFFWTQSTCSASIYFLKNSTLTNVICWKRIFYNVWCLLPDVLTFVCGFSIKANSKHKNETRFSSSRNYYIYVQPNFKTESKSRFFNFFRFGAKLWNAIPNEFRQLQRSF